MLEKLSNSNIKLLNDWKKQIDSYIEIYKEAYKKQLTRLSKLETQLQSIQTRLKQVESSLEKMPEYFKKLERAHTAAVIKTGLMSTGIGIGIAVIGGVILYFALK
jgi:septation ring formation regulator EzrA